MLRLIRNVCTVVVALAGTVASPVSATQTTSFSGTLLSVQIDTGAGTYAGITAGTPFSGAFTYGSFAGDATAIHSEPNETNYAFGGSPCGSSIGDGIKTTIGTLTNINIQNDMPLTADEAALATLISGMPFSAGTAVDVWTAGGLTSGAFYDAGNSLINGTSFEVVLFTRDTGLFNSTDFRAIPPTLAATELGVFSIEQANALGETVFFGIGRLDSIAAIPEPSSYLMLAAGIAWLGFLVRRRHLRAAR